MERPSDEIYQWLTQGLAIAVVLCTGCGPHAGLHRFSREFECPIEQSSLFELGAHSVRVTGCGHTAVYVCLGEVGNMACSLETHANVRRERPPPPPTVRRDQTSTHREIRVGSQQLPVLRLRLADMNVDFAPEPGPAAPMHYRLELSMERGRVEDCPLVWLADRRAVRAVQRPHSPQYRLSADSLRAMAGASTLRVSLCGHSLELTAQQRADVREFFARANVAAAPPGAPPHAASAPRGPPTAPPSLAESSAQIRRVIDAHGVSILACVGRPAIGVVVAWSETEPLSVSLRPPLSATPEEACVRSVLGNIDVPVSGSGRVVHVVAAN